MRDHLDECVLYHAGELSEGDCFAFERHKEACPACKELLEALAMGSRAARVCALKLPPAARARAIGSGRAAPVAARRPVWALVLALALLGLWIRSPRPAAVASWAAVDGEFSRVDREMEALSASITRSGTDIEIDAACARLEGAARELRRSL
ncbi:MAG: hypothetical protein NTX64_14930 [Elusimicrobia bacterium]|nr:hypothetical protein [Elusimicrobiota bacterium]